ncbi:MAG: hypothetical protein ACFKPT_29440 [Gloeotrichia echinulata GP01]|nr:hypothetical protein [Gloeotrichia echinulata DEX184]
MTGTEIRDEKGIFWAKFLPTLKGLVLVSSSERETSSSEAEALSWELETEL